MSLNIFKLYNLSSFVTILISVSNFIFFFFGVVLGHFGRWYEKRNLKGFLGINGSVFALHTNEYWPIKYNNQHKFLIDEERDYIKYGNVETTCFPLSTSLFNKKMQLTFKSYDEKFVYYYTNYKAVHGLSGTPLIDDEGNFISILTHFVGSEVHLFGSYITYKVSIVAFPIINYNQVIHLGSPSETPIGLITKTAFLNKIDYLITMIDSKINEQRFTELNMALAQRLNEFLSRFFDFVNSIGLFEVTYEQTINISKFIPTMVLFSSVANVYLAKTMISSLRSKDWLNFLSSSFLYITTAMFSMVATIGSIGNLNIAVTLITLFCILYGVMHFYFIEDSIEIEKNNLHHNTNFHDITKMEIFLLILISIPILAYFNVPILGTIYDRIVHFLTSCVNNIYFLKSDRYVRQVLGNVSNMIASHGSSFINVVSISFGKATSLIPVNAPIGNFSTLDFLFRGRDSFTTKNYMTWILDPDFANFVFVFYWFTIYRVNGLITEPPFNIDKGYTWDTILRWLLFGPTIEYAAVFKCLITTYIASSFRSMWFFPIAFFLSNAICFFHLRTVIHMHIINADSYQTKYHANYMVQVNDYIIRGKDIVSNIIALTTGLSVIMAVTMECYWFATMCILTTLCMYYVRLPLVDAMVLLFFLIDSPFIIITLLIMSYFIPTTWFTACRFRLPPYPYPKMASGTGIGND